MRISYNWLKDFLPDLALTPPEVAELLTMHIFETEIVGDLSLDPAVIVARITDIQPHPNADRLRLATVTTGSEEVTVVCGAPNIEVGDTVPYAPPGTTLHAEDGQKFQLKTATIRGVDSPGMLNSPRELGLGESHAGIYILPPNAPLGSKLADHIPPDTILEVDITPNRAHDCFSHRGLAREVAAIRGLTLNEPKLRPIPGGTPYGWKVKVDAPNDVLRYFLIPVTGVAVAPSPLWMQARLWAAGARPINNIVDITNYVTFEIGNPSHAFDSHKMPGRIITIRRANRGETLTTLDAEPRRLTADDLVITAANEPQALAGVIGGEGSEVTNTTEEILIEVASFAAYLVQQTSARFHVRTQSSMRFAKGLSPALAAEAASRVVHFVQEITGGKIDGYLEYYPHVASPKELSFRPERVAVIAGTDITPEQCRQALTHLRCTIQERDPGTPWHVTPPIERLDLTGEHELVEEVIRLIGLTAIPAAPLPAITAPPLPRKVQIRELLRDELVGAGFTEVYNRPFEHERFTGALALDTAQTLELVNPVAPEQSRLRTSLLPGLLANLVTNKGEIRKKRPQGSRNLFETGSVWQAGESTWVPGIREEEWMSGVIVDPLDVEGLIKTILTKLGAASVPDSVCQIEPISSSALAALRLPAHIQSFAINLDQLVLHVANDFAYQPRLEFTGSQYQATSKYPPVIRDLSFLVDPDLTVEAVQAVIERTGGQLVADVDLFDEYQPAGSSKKGLAFRITYQASDRTLTADEVNARHNNILAILQKEMAAELRE